MVCEENKIIQWFPGHIAKATKEIKSYIKLVDLIIEIIDARCPISTLGIIDENIKNKKHLIIMNKIDLADDYKTSFFSQKIQKIVSDAKIILIDSRKNNIKNIIDKQVDLLCKNIYEKNENKGIKNTVLKAMVVGMPNVGKSTFINSYVKKILPKLKIDQV